MNSPQLVLLGASVYGFDCTDYKRNSYQFQFYPWCIGKNTSTFDESNRYSARVDKTVFMPLKDIKEKLGHKKIHMLKFDIEGFEWELFENDILHADPADLPDQLLFELHTEGANHRWVPEHNVRHKRHHQVNELIYNLWKLGYRCINIEINHSDKHCAEMVFVRLPGDSSGLPLGVTVPTHPSAGGSPVKPLHPGHDSAAAHHTHSHDGGAAPEKEQR